MRRAIVVLALAVLVAPAAAQEVSLDVPVRVADLHPSVSVGSITCALFADPDGPRNNLGYLGNDWIYFWTIK